MKELTESLKELEENPYTREGILARKREYLEVEKLGDTILRCFPDYPGNHGESEGAIQCAIRIIADCEAKLRRVDFSKAMVDYYRDKEKPNLSDKQHHMLDGVIKMIGMLQATGKPLAEKKKEMASAMVGIILNVATIAVILDVSLEESWEQAQKVMTETEKEG